MIIFYAPDVVRKNTLSEEESAHAVKVLRVKPGDEIYLVDGKGGFFRSRITMPHQKKCEFEVIEQLENPDKRNYRIHIAIAPTKNIDRFEWFIEKAVEIGVDRITPVITRYSERKIIKPERLEKIIISASKQSLKAGFTVLDSLCGFGEFVEKCCATQQFIAHCYSGSEKKQLQSVYQKDKDAIVLIGPEGDFSNEEVETAINQYRYLPVSLGESRLRTETAGIIACATAAFVNQQ
ncbi:MAG: 16S rRNA (uracil(1498)-N(3))-methyltransferase [Prevotellaceae bacterium]|jgi:16S rRNA (uracil1498-N3)-methyltransferase|nr:16S rRNA (uracil(1498)-N(3))-methyltransferase [Prevotellaceae bacterium]